MSLDNCIPIPPVTVPTCITPTESVNCNTVPISVDICSPPIDNPGEPKCVNDNAKRPWPTPPPVEIGCNPVSLRVTNTPTEEDDPNQTVRLEGSVTYISGDACLPQVNLNLVVPETIASGGGSPNPRGFGYTQYADCVRVGPNEDYATPQDFAAEAPGAATFVPKTQQEMQQAGSCESPCDYRARFGSQVAKFNLIGPILCEIISSTPAAYVSVNGTYIATGWRYRFQTAFCVTAANQCLPACTPSHWTTYPGSLTGDEAWNNKEMVYSGYLTPGVNLRTQLQMGFRPTPIMSGTQVLMYGWVPWGPNEPQACSCDIIWFFSEQVAFDGECVDNDGITQGATSMLPQRNITSAGMFFGSPNNADRV